MTSLASDVIHVCDDVICMCVYRQAGANPVAHQRQAKRRHLSNHRLDIEVESALHGFVGRRRRRLLVVGALHVVDAARSRERKRRRHVSVRAKLVLQFVPSRVIFATETFRAPILAFQVSMYLAVHAHT